MHTDDQLEAEANLEHLAAGIARDRLDAGIKQKGLVETAGGKQLVKRCIADISRAVDGWMVEHLESRHKPSSHKYLACLTADEIALITLRSSLTNLGRTRHLSYHKFVRHIADRVVVAVEARLYQLKDTKEFDSLARRLDWQSKSYIRSRMVKEVFVNECLELELSDYDLVHLGTILTELMIDSTGLFEAYTRGSGKSMSKLIKPTPKAQEWLTEAYELSLMAEPFNLPMLIPPFDWTNLKDGGYLLQNLHPATLVRANIGGEGFKRLEQADLTKVMSAVNHIQKTPWRINQRVHDVWRSLLGSGLAGCSTSTAVVVPEAIPNGLPGYEDRKAERRICFEAISQNNSSRMSEIQKMRLADIMIEHSEFYYPHNCDFRSRIYPMCGIGSINPQGDDSGKALLEFADGKPLGDDGLQWLYIHTQNTLGNDKVSLQDRIDATAANLSVYQGYATNPMVCTGWMVADKPFGFLACCLELLDISQIPDPSTYESHIPVALDGSCSGLQHFAGLMLDQGLAKAVNVISTGGKPMDIYQMVVDNVNNLLLTLDTPEAMYWRGKVHRNLIKQNVMTLPYSVTASGMRNQIADACKKLVYRKGDQEYAIGATAGYAGYLVELVMQSITQVSSGAFMAMNWLAEAAKAQCEAHPNSIDGALHWTTPVGFPITQEYYEFEAKRINIFYDGRRIRFTQRIGASTTCKSKQRSGAPANFTHGNDSAHLMMTVNAAQELAGGELSLAMIHDSFGCHPSDTGLLFEVLRAEFSTLYQGDALMQLYTEMSPQAQLKVGLPPARGGLDLALVQDSEFFFS